MFVGPRRRDPTTRRSLEEPELEQIRLIHIHDRICFLTGRGGNGVDAYWSTAELLDNGLQYPTIGVVQPQLVNFQHLESRARHLRRDHAARTHLRVIPHAAK